MNLMIVDKDEFEKETRLFNSISMSESAKHALCKAEVKGIDAIKQLIRQEKEKNDVLLKKQQNIVERNEEYQKFIDRMEGSRA